MKDFPEYSVRARDAVDLFLIDSHSVIFYFEDSHHESVYERLLDKLIPNLRHFAVVCLGGKSRVIAKAKEPRPAGVISVFVTDKDFDDLLGKTVDIEGLHYLGRNCLENYLLDLNILAAISIEQNPDLTKAKVGEGLADQARYLSVLEERYVSLTRLFLVANKYGVGNVKTTKMAIDDLLVGAEDTFPVPTLEFLVDYRGRLQANCHGDNEWLTDDTALDVQLEEAFSPVIGGHPLTTEISHHLSGKHLFRCLVRYVKACLGVDLDSIDPRSLYLRMLAQLDLIALHPLRDQLLHRHPNLTRA